VDIRKVGWEVVNWIRLTQNRDLWRALVNTVMKHEASQKVGKFLD